MFIKTGFLDIHYRATRLNVSEKEQGFVDAVATLTDDALTDQFTVYKYVVQANK